MADEMTEKEAVFCADDCAEAEDTVVSVPPIAADTVPRAELEALKSAHAEEIRTLKAKFALSFCIAESGAKNPALVGRLIDVSDVPFSEDGEPDMTAVRKKLSDMKQSDRYLFNDAGGVPSAVTGGEASESGFSYVGGTGDPARMSDAEYYRMRRAGKRSM